MEYKDLTKNIKISSLGLGTWHMGGAFRPDYSDDRRYIEAIAYAIEKGITHIDTAEIYAHGHTEELVCQAIKTHDRSKLFITSKVSPHHLTYRGVLAACKRSLERLGTDYLDLYLIHWPNPVARMKKVMTAFDQLIAGGKIRFVGVSNFSTSQWQEAQAYSHNRVATNQIHYSLLHRVEPDLLDYAKAEQLLITGYSPLEQGRLADGDYPLLDEIAKKHNKTKIQVTLRWLLDQPQVITIPKASSRVHIDEMMGSLGWQLDKADFNELGQSFLGRD